MGLFPLLIVWLGLNAVEGTPSVVTAASSVDVFAAPDSGSYLSQTLGPGAKLTVRGERDGWITIDAPADAIDWIDASTLGERSGNQALVTAEVAEVRSGRIDAKWPGPPTCSLRRGDMVQFVKLAPLALRVGRGGKTTWLAIRPPASDMRFVRSDALRSSMGSAVSRDSALTKAAHDDPPIPAEISDELVRIDASHRSMLREQVEAWELAPVRDRYQALAKRATDPNSRAILARRLERLQSEMTLAESAKKFTTLLKQSRKRDGEVERLKTRLEQARKADREAYTAIGMIQPSSKEIEGRRVHVLIGSDGSSVAYLDIPPGIDVERFTTRRVGIRGTLRYDEALASRFIVVRDVEPVGKGD